jgi:hypothetical protein
MSTNYVTISKPHMNSSQVLPSESADMGSNHINYLALGTGGHFEIISTIKSLHPTTA